MLLSSSTLSRIERLRFNPRKRVTSRHQGDHLRGRGGNSTEFSDFRDYAPGDDTRFIDWNIFSRLNKPYMKLYRLEEEMHVVIIIDASQSMIFDGKFECARRLAAALATIGLYSNEKVSLYVLQDETRSLPENMVASSGRFHKGKFCQFLDNITPGGSLTLDQGVNQVIKRHSGKGMAIIISDFFTAGDLEKTFNQLFSSGLTPYALHIMSEAELTPQLTGDVRFVDCETQKTLDVSAAGRLFDLYEQYLNDFCSRLQSACSLRNGLYSLVQADANLDDLLCNTLVRKGWLR